MVNKRGRTILTRQITNSELKARFKKNEITGEYEDSEDESREFYEKVQENTKLMQEEDI